MAKDEFREIMSTNFPGMMPGEGYFYLRMRRIEAEQQAEDLSVWELLQLGVEGISYYRYRVIAGVLGGLAIGVAYVIMNTPSEVASDTISVQYSQHGIEQVCDATREMMESVDGLAASEESIQRQCQIAAERMINPTRGKLPPTSSQSFNARIIVSQSHIDRLFSTASVGTGSP